jgi:hypothetical protein
MAWYNPLKSTERDRQVYVPRGYALMPGTIARKGKMEARSLDREMPMASRVSTYKMLRLLPPSISTLVKRLLPMMGLTTSG